MGKRNKVKSQTHDISLIKDTKTEKISKEKRKIKKNKDSVISKHAQNVLLVEEEKHEVGEIDINCRSTKKKKVVIYADKDLNSDTPKNKSKQEKISDRKKADIGASNHNDSNKIEKQIIPNVNSVQSSVNETQEKSFDITADSKGIISKNKNKDPFDEDLIKDEEIDRFCEEITEEDNAEYENWIQLLEAKLHPNKKS